MWKKINYGTEYISVNGVKLWDLVPTEVKKCKI